MSTLIELLKFEGKEINHLFEKASIEGKGTPQEVSDRRENALTIFLKKYFPFPYRVAKGNIRDSYGGNSMSIDCLILNPSHPYTTTNESQFSIILADGVDVAIELKPSLNSESEIERSLTQIKSVKELTRVNTSLLDFGNKYTEKYKNNSKKIPAIIFSNKTYKDYSLLIEKAVAFYEKNKIKREYQFDFIVINQKCIIFNCKKDSYISFKEFGEGIYILEFGELTIAAFLFQLNAFPQSEMRISNPIINHYLKIKHSGGITFEKLNKRLAAI
ncbi:DUF6602 domain-containing protein [Tenacibaculum halocynthiae]|uniref:DUF6602 domain-containing protein n=1 Tax=Tenacibaculum halocynthiae TaxID=1254437 RepID=UPI0038951048